MRTDYSEDFENYVEKLKGKPGIRADWKKQIGGQVFHY